MFRRWLQGFSVYRDRRVIAIAFLGFASGLPLALTFSTLTFWLKEEGLTKTAIGLFASVATPYSLKFVWAPLVDRLNLPLLTAWLGRRRGWILLSQVALMLSIFALGATDPAIDAWMTAAMAVLVAFCSATQDIVIDAYRVEVLEERQYAAGAAAVVFGYRIGMLVSGAGALLLANHYEWGMVYTIMGLLVTIGMAATLLSPEPEDVDLSRTDELREQAEAYLDAQPGMGGWFASISAWLYVAAVRPLAEFMQRHGAIVILLFVVFYKFGDTLAGVMTNPFLLEMGFSKTEIAQVVKTYGLVATLAGAAAGGSLMTQVGLLRSLWICGLLQMLSNLMFAVQAGVGHSVAMLAVTIGLENFASGMGTAAFVAYLSSLCNVSYTATQYALLTSLMSVARSWLSASGGWLADQMPWASFFILTTVAAVPGLLLLAWIGRSFTPDESDPDEAYAGA